MLYGYLIRNISNAKNGSLFYFTLNVKSSYNRLQLVYATRYYLDKIIGDNWVKIVIGISR